MPQLMQPRDQAAEHTVVAGDTLATIAARQCATLGWKVLARYNFGTDDPAEVLRALVETCGVKLADAIDPLKAVAPENLALAPLLLKPPGGVAPPAPKLKIPKTWMHSGLAVEKLHTVKVKPLLPASAVGIDELDKWFVPGLEACTVKYRLEGLKECADKVQLDVFGNNYCECTGWSEGLGTYGDPAALIDEPVYKLDLAAQAAQRTPYALPDPGWKGEANTASGLLSRKTGTAAARHINVAFSPYTAHFRYWKADGDKAAHLVLEPFWPVFDETKTELADANTDHAGVRKVMWTNAALADRGIVRITDKNAQQVHAAVIEGDLLKAGARELAWDGQYAYGAVNSLLGNAVVAADGPYAAKVLTFVDKPKADSLKIKWKVRHGGGKLVRGLLRITDGKDRPVFQQPLAAADVADGEHTMAWDGKYAEGIKNSLDGTEVIAADMPYRLQIQAHSDFNVAEGLAVAAMHTEVRLYVGKAVPLKHAMYEPFAAKSTATLSLGTMVPDTAVDQLPVFADGTRWYRYKLGEFGFNAGPITVSASADSAYKPAILEFKRSVPAEGAPASGTFKRLVVLNAAGPTGEENAALRTAIDTIRDKDKRSRFGDPSLVASNSDAPDLADAATVIADPTKEVILWVDDRQYYTEHWNPGDPPKDEDGDVYVTGPAAPANAAQTEKVGLSKSFGLHNYRGGYTNGETKVQPLDQEAIARPWLPLRFSPLLLKRTQTLADEIDASAVTGAERSAMAKALGPLRVDWAFDELPADLAALDATPYDKKLGRPKRYVAWAIDDSKSAEHTRLDTDRKTRFINCKADWGGVRPTASATYYEKLFGLADLSLRPWKATADATTETVATVLHDHIAAAQKDKTAQPDKYLVDLFEPLLGSAGALFNPSTVGGDGWRVRADLRFKKFAGYDFPNLDPLAARYPATPQAYSAKLRAWRRSSVRGFFGWGTLPLTGWPDFITGMRKHYRAAHVYFVHEGGTANNLNVTDFFNAADPTDRQRYQDIIRQNFDSTYPLATLKQDFVWPWDDDPHYGYKQPSAVNEASFWTNYWRNTIHLKTWHKLNAALLMGVLQGVEKKKGLMRGHLLGEFVSSGKACFRYYACDGTQLSGGGGGTVGPHKYFYLEKGPASGTKQMDGQNCPFPGCQKVVGTHPPTPGKLSYATYNWSHEMETLGVDAVGQSLGATWLFPPTADFGGSHAGVWTHEVGHHRHFEHAATAPSANAMFHDSEDNEQHFEPAAVAAFAPSVANGAALLAVSFTNTSTGAVQGNRTRDPANKLVDGVTWHWDFGDGLYSTAKEPTHTYRAVGSYTVTLSICSGRAASTSTATITVTAKPPDVVAAFTASVAAGDAALAVTFTDTSTGTPTGWLWRFGDGAVSTDQNPSHSYVAAGKFDVELIAYNTHSHASHKLQVTVAPPTLRADSFGMLAPVVGGSASVATGAAPLSVTFTDASSPDPEQPIATTFRWDFGDGQFAATANAVHLYAQPGTYHPVLTVGNDFGGESRLELTPVVVTGPRVETARFDCSTATGERTAGAEIKFADTSTGAPTKWLWFFGDGMHSTAQHPSHDFAAGNSMVELYATGPDGVSYAKLDLVVAAAGAAPVAPVVQTPGWMRWDRRCIMSYSRTDYSENEEHFCGKCVLRNRGWKVSQLLLPGKSVHEEP